LEDVFFREVLKRIRLKWIW